MSTASGWLVWALLSAAFAALTAIFAEGVKSDHHADPHHGDPRRARGLRPRHWHVEQSARALGAHVGIPRALRPRHGGLLGVLLPRAQDRRLQGSPPWTRAGGPLRVPPRAPVATRVNGHLHGGGRRPRACRPEPAPNLDFVRTPHVQPAGWRRGEGCAQAEWDPLVLRAARRAAIQASG